MDHVRRFAPISSDRSNRLELVAGYFALNGVVVLCVLAFGLAHALVSRTSDARSVLVASPTGPILAAAMGCVSVLVAWQLFHRRRGAAVAAIVLLTLPLVGWVLGAAVGGISVVLNVIGLLLIGSAWKELEPDTWWPRRAGRAG